MGGKLKAFQAEVKEIRVVFNRAFNLLGGMKNASTTFDGQVEKIQKYLSKCDEISTDENIELWTSQGAKSLEEWGNYSNDFKANYDKALREQRMLQSLCEETVNNLDKLDTHFKECGARLSDAKSEGGKLLAQYEKGKKTEKAAGMRVALESLEDMSDGLGELAFEVDKLMFIVEKCRKHLRNTRSRR